MKHITYLVCLLLSSCAVPTKTEGWCFPKSVSVVMLTAFLLAFAVTSKAEMPQAPLHVQCSEVKGVSICAIREADLDEVIETNNKAWDMLAQALTRIKELESQGMRCAKVDVVEPPKHSVKN